MPRKGLSDLYEQAPRNRTPRDLCGFCADCLPQGDRNPWLAARIEPGTTIAQFLSTMNIAELQALPDIRGWRLGSRLAHHRPLSPREGQIVEMVTAGRSHKEIAFELGISNATVRVLSARAMGKLGRSKHKPE